MSADEPQGHLAVAQGDELAGEGVGQWPDRQMRVLPQQLGLEPQVPGLSLTLPLRQCVRAHAREAGSPNPWPVRKGLVGRCRVAMIAGNASICGSSA
jgi:hypothetical protein